MKLHNIFQTVVGGLLLFGASACTDEVKFDPTAPVSGEGIYFAADASTTIDIEADATVATVPLYRTNAEGSYTANITSSVTDADGNPVNGILTVPGQVVFADGQAETSIEVGVDFAKVEPEEIYYVHMSLEGNETSPYGVLSQTFEFTYAPWTEWKAIANAADPGYYQQTVLWGNLYPTYVYYRESMTNPNRCQYAVDSPFSHLEYEIIWEMDKSKTMMVDGTECYRCIGSNYVNTTVNSSNGVPYFYGEISYWFLNVVGVAPENLDAILERNDMIGSYYNPVQGRFYLQMIIWDSSLEPGYSYGNDYETLQLPGNFKDYFLTFNYTGNYVDTEGNETGIINATRSEDLNAFGYAIRPGTLSEEEVDAIVEELAEDTELHLYYDYSTNISVEFEEEGDYTIVGAGFDESGAYVCKSSLTFTYKSVQKESEWESIGWCEYTDGIIWGMWGLKNGGYLGGNTYEVEVEKSKVDPTMYRLVNPYRQMGEDYGIGLSGNYYLPFQIFPSGGVILWEAALGLASPTGEGNLGVYSYAENFVNQGNTPAEVADTPWAGTFKDGVITFNACTLFLTFEGDDNLYFVNYNDQALQAMKDKTFDQQLLPTGYGTGKFRIDMSYIDMSRAPKKVAARGNHSINDIKGANMLKADDLKRAGHNATGIKSTVGKVDYKNNRFTKSVNL